MVDLNSIKEKVNQMAKSATSMWKLTYDAFIEHDVELISKALEEESKLNALEDEINQSVIDLGHADVPQKEKLRVVVYADIAADFELIGDYCKDILERIQIKIEEKLLFSEGAVEEYKDLYSKTKEALEEVVFVLEKDNPALIKEVLRKEEHIDSLVDKYRHNHGQRMLAGECTPMGCNMFLNMLDFTAAVYYHIKKIAKSLLQIK
ncbi:MAG: PhoU domain-containing protein [Candidatus Omnitrophota bacterium]|jgi:phosphate:Na+ symporter|nr:PhoU domain-containing protein [Candidatus Omnitrophota bacterium]MDD5518684.1 PhoU domain-containing protein [Candidatus Omnitrophota bacterium]